MIDVAIIRVKDGSTDRIKTDFLPEAVREKIEATKDQGEKKLKIASYAFLYKLFPEETKTIVCNNGKPSFSAPAPVFNISHSEEYCAIAYSSNAEASVGVDIQAEPKKRGLLSRLAERFFAPFDSSKEAKASSVPMCNVSFFEILNGEFRSTDAPMGIQRLSAPDAKRDLLAKWTILEAVLKASGGGFEDYPECDELLACVPTETFAFFGGDEIKYAVTVAVTEREKGEMCNITDA